MHNLWITYFGNCCSQGSLWSENSGQERVTNCDSDLETSPQRNSFIEGLGEGKKERASCKKREKDKKLDLNFPSQRLRVEK